MALELLRVVLEFEFAPLKEQEEDDIENTWPHDYVSMMVAEVGRTFGGLPEELQEVCDWTETTLVVTTEYLDGFLSDLIQFAMDSTIPRKMTLTIDDYR